MSTVDGTTHEVRCPKCGAFLALSRGLFLVFNKASIDRATTLRCAECKARCRWEPQKPVDAPRPVE